MRPQSAKAKGRRLQQQIACSIKAKFPELKDNDVQSVSMGTNGEDIVMSPLAESLFPYSIECKNAERLNVWNAIDQCENNALRNKTPLIAISKNRAGTFAVLPWDHFMTLVNHPEHDTPTPADNITDLVGDSQASANGGMEGESESPSAKRQKLSACDDATILQEIQMHISEANRLFQNVTSL